MLFSEYIGNLNSTIELLDEKQITGFIDLIYKAYIEEKMVFVIGNGGSAANASHLAQDLAKGTRRNLAQIKRIKALSLTDNLPFITALGNDDGYDTIFEQQLITFANPGDILICISGSGNSPNILKATKWATEHKLITVGITGFDGGELMKLCEHSVHVPLNNMFIVESIHSVIFHYILIELNNILAKERL
ncbi:MAG: SIS domain-containing protein [Bacteroidota bacterium]